jgi:hypothetical protein
MNINKIRYHRLLLKVSDMLRFTPAHYLAFARQCRGSASASMGSLRSVCAVLEQLDLAGFWISILCRRPALDSRLVCSDSALSRRSKAYPLAPFLSWTVSGSLGPSSSTSRSSSLLSLCDTPKWKPLVRRREARESNLPWAVCFVLLRSS